jgi:hypothetical protein
MKKILFVLCMLVVPAVSAGEYWCHSFGKNGCTEHIADIVTDRFTSKYPSDKFMIVAIYQFMVYSDGGGVGYAVAGVVPRVRVNGTEITQVPARRFNATKRLNGKNVDARQQNVLEIETMRSAVDSLMAECDREKNCDLLK